MPSRRLLSVVPALFALSSAAHAISFTEGGWISAQVSQVSSVTTVDFNRDGRSDLVVRENQGKKVVWLENFGEGRFRPVGLWEASFNNNICAGVADFDGDGIRTCSSAWPQIGRILPIWKSVTAAALAS